MLLKAQVVDLHLHHGAGIHSVLIHPQVYAEHAKKIENKSVVPVVNYQTLVLEIEMFHNPKNTTAIAICLQNHAIYLDLQCLYCLKTPLYRHDSVV